MTKKLICKTAFIIITSSCNVNCLHCFYNQDSFRKKADRLSQENLDSILNKVKDAGFTEVCLTGGEPMTRKKEVLFCVQRCKELGLDVNVDTNGIFLNSEIVKELSDAGVTKLFLSAMYLNKQLLVDLQSNKIPFSVVHILTKENLESLPEVIKQADKNGHELVIQPAYINKDNKYYDRLSFRNLSEVQWNYLITEIKPWLEKNKKQKYWSLIQGYYNKTKGAVKPTYCHMGVDDLVVDSDGSVFPCFHRQDLLAGNIVTDDFDLILRNLVKFSKQTKSAKCFGEHCLSLYYSI
ncbi:radical SAM protein [Candidatus Falkowbacteria bacterium]|nr:radical SAM protein [Candidatus Falkowbacteria bacterium]MBT5503117.1 radical SAM protein [Candidatus Falkowbacteria bacterium]MBT6573911.1 radical SAM protein [Candidatus Falkowbacteria bacterium]MBT7348188.1 radical SAM protein [Candidatus Falkowbacteria bacterium]MBT7501254.1 radical SAM protein [Candidatus Falkowbacteria bacterium]